MLIRQALERTAHHRAVEQRLFELVGRWAPEAGDAELTRVLAAQAHHHAWRATMWDALVPVLHDVPAPVPAVDAVLAPLVPPSAAGLATVLESIVAGYESDLARATEVSDAPVARVLQLVLHDTRADMVALETFHP